MQSVFGKKISFCITQYIPTNITNPLKPFLTEVVLATLTEFSKSPIEIGSCDISSHTNLKYSMFKTYSNVEVQKSFSELEEGLDSYDYKNISKNEELLSFKNTDL